MARSKFCGSESPKNDSFVAILRRACGMVAGVYCAASREHCVSSTLLVAVVTVPVCGAFDSLFGKTCYELQSSRINILSWL